MESLIKKYASKLLEQGLCDDALIGGLDAEIVWNRDGEEIPVLTQVISSLNINSILFMRPSEPYFSIMNIIAQQTAGDNTIYPGDTETRTFLHDIPVVREFEAREIAASLRRRKSVIVQGRGIVTYGIVSPEQAFITASSVCFASYIAFFTHYYGMKRRGDPAIREYKRTAESALALYGNFIAALSSEPECRGPFNTAENAMLAMCEAGRLTVRSRMVDSFFGNISCRMGGDIIISQTGSSLDELEGHIDICPMDNSSTAAITASSELSAHRGVYERTGSGVILHGHPKFSVIISMLCDEECDVRGLCHVKCPRIRNIADIPIVPGEVGTGPTGISTTLPPAMKGRGAIVYGHGLFTAGDLDFIDAYRSLIDIEGLCFEDYRQRME